jgi:hypothetical protein
VVLKDPAADSFQFLVPGGLFFVDGNIAVNITDARVLKVAMDLVRAAGRDATQYKVLSKTFDQLLGTFAYWTDGPSGPMTRAQRDFVVQTLVADLNATFLERQAGFSVAATRTLLLSAIDTATLALTVAPQAEGLLNFQAPDAQGFAADLAAQLAFLNTAILTDGQQPFPHAPDYKLSLKAYFDSPLDRTSLQTASSGAGIFQVAAGDPAATYASGRNDRMKVDGEAVKTALKPIFSLPADMSSTSCTPGVTPSGCPANYTCQSNDGGATYACQFPNFELLDQSKVDQAIPGNGPPAFVNPSDAKPLAVIY